MRVRLHHTHIFASDIDRTLQFWKEMFGAEILFDQMIAGARNVMIAIGDGRLNIYDQPPREGPLQRQEGRGRGRDAGLAQGVEEGDEHGGSDAGRLPLNCPRRPAPCGSPGSF